MRKVDYRSIVPQSLNDMRAVEARRIISDFLDEPDEARLSRRAPVDERIYTDSQVIEALQKLYHGKCGFCETRKEGLHVDHFRPIANAGGGRFRFPHHYSWLAYSWDNLLLACEQCSRRKANFFGLMSGRRAQLKAPLGQIRATETPKLLDPGYDTPFRHLDFTLDGHVYGVTRRGRATIAILELNRVPLVEERRNQFGRLESHLRGADREDIILWLRRIGEPTEPFSGAQQILRHRFLSMLAAKAGPFKIGFDDGAELIDDLVSRASTLHIAEVLEALRTPKLGTPTQTEFKQSPRPSTAPITRIFIENFKSIDCIDINMQSRRLNSKAAAALMLLGENATGKSSVLEAVTLALTGAEQANAIADARLFVPSAARGGHSGPHGSPRVVIEFVEGPPAILKIQDGQFVDENRRSANVIAYSSNRYFKPRKRRSKSGARGLLDPTWGLPNPETWLKKLNPDQFQDVARALAEILVLPRGAYIKRGSVLGTVIVDGELVTPITEHSDGYRSIFATAVDMLAGLRGSSDLLDAEGVVLIDEIETHLHPRWKMRLMTAFRSALPRVQFIVTTHDPLCLRGMGTGEVQVMARDENHQIVLLPDLPDVSGMRIDQILTSEHFGLQSTLDPSLEKLFEEYHKLLLLQDADPASKERIETLRQQINTQQEIGQTERERRLLAAIDRHLAKEANEGGVRAQQERSLDQELDAIWTEAEATPL